MRMTNLLLKPAILPRAVFKAILVLHIIGSGLLSGEELPKECCVQFSRTSGGVCGVLFNDMLVINYLGD